MRAWIRALLTLAFAVGVVFLANVRIPRHPAIRSTSIRPGIP